MSCGGNRRFSEYLNNFGLNGEMVDLKYNSKAADFYRIRLRSECDGTELNIGEPPYDTGRE